MLLDRPSPVDTSPLRLADLPVPEPGPGEVLLRVRYCGICRTDLHVVEGELPPRLAPLIPGHQIVGTVERLGPGAPASLLGQRSGVAWLHQTCGKCSYCASARENLCDHALFTGYSRHGGFAEFAAAPADFLYPIPDGFEDLHAAPLLCAGIIGYRSLKRSGIQPSQHLGLYGFGAAAHVAIQVALHWGVRVSVSTRHEKHRALALSLGAQWAGGTLETPPEPLDSAIIFAPAGEIVPAALAALRKGGILALGGIHMSPIPEFPYSLLYGEREIRSVMNNTRQDGHEFLKLAAEIPIRPQVEVFPLEQANRALQRLKGDAIQGAGVLKI